MCIIFFSSHSSCTHTHLLSTWPCGLNCSTSARHTFYLAEPGYDCSTCTFLHGEEFDPDVVPVEYYSPLFDPVKDEEKREREKREIQEALYAEDDKALSDPESETEYWRGEGDVYATPKRRGHKAADEDTTPQQMTPRTAAHKKLVRDQLKKVPKVHFQPTGHFHMVEPMGQTAGNQRFWIPPAPGGEGRES